MVAAEVELSLGEDHPAGDLAPELHFRERLAVGQLRTRQGDCNSRALAEVPGAADDLARLAFADIDAAELKAVGVRMLAGLHDPADPEQAEISVVIGPPRWTIRSTSTLVKTARPPSPRAGRQVDVLPKPGDGDFSKLLQEPQVVLPKRRMSGSPCRSRAIRSSPNPNANPDTFSGS